MNEGTQGSEPDRSRRRLYLAAVLAGVAFAYLVNYDGLWCSNDGSQFALVRAIGERGSFRLGPDSDLYTHRMDYARSPRGGIYSDRPPGMALLLAPLYALGYWGARAFGRTDVEMALRMLVALTVGAFAVANVGLVYWGARRLRAGTWAALAGAAVFAFAGLAYRYSTLLFSHTPSVTTTLLGACLLLGPAPQKRRWLAYPAIGLLMGYAVMIEYQNAIFSAMFFAVWAGRLLRRRDGGAVALIALGAAVPAVFLASYQYACFGSALRSTHSFNPGMAHNKSLGTIFAGRFVDGMHFILTSRQTGILIYAPVFVFGPAGLVWAARRGFAMAWAVLAAAAVYTFVIAHHVTIVGGATMDCRYFFPVASLMAFGFGPFLTWVGGQSDRFNRHGLLALFGLLAAYSIGMSTHRMVRAKIIVTTNLPAAQEFCLGWFTFLCPDQNMERIYLNYFVISPLVKQGRRPEAFAIVRRFCESRPSVWNMALLQSWENALLPPSAPATSPTRPSPGSRAQPPASSAPSAREEAP
ncbi:MAG: hypothetical protein NTW86_03170 [Candidatus Sumerlaeota bacterium]|nr:hypothetical protein [Candidatus Sumerlaeota bacterium]